MSTSSDTVSPPARRSRIVAAFPAILIVLAMVGAVVLASAGSSHQSHSGSAVFEPITVQRIDLGPAVSEASSPIFTHDGTHLLFFSSLQLWEVADDGSGLTCLSCAMAHVPALSPSEQMGFATPFPDDRRVFFGAADSVAVLECAPSVDDCVHKTVLPVDLSGARPNGGSSSAGGADTAPSVDLGGGVAPKLSPDGTHIAFSDIRSDTVELMILATLTRGDHGYTTSDPRVLNPPAPVSPSDTDSRHWSDSSGLFEFKSFADGGAAATYVQVGGPGANNPDVWRLDLATGTRTRLTSYPDWDEDNAPSPDDQSLVVESDRGMHRVDRFGALAPIPDFLDDPESAILAAYLVGAGGAAADIGALRQCDLQPWLLPADGDRGAALMGQPLLPYTGGDVHVANNVSGYPQWSPDGTKIALNTQRYSTNRSAPYLLIAHLDSRPPTVPVPVHSSEPGPWAPAPADYHAPLAGTNHVVLQGANGGTVTVDYRNPKGVFAGADSAVYRDYSDVDGIVVNGTDTIGNPDLVTGPVTVDADLTISGAHTGYLRQHVVFSGLRRTPWVTATGTTEAAFDGTTVSGVPPAPQACPADLPRPPQLELSTQVHQRSGALSLAVQVTAEIPGAGRDEAGVDRRPVRAATVTAGTVTARTDASGEVVLAIPAGTPEPVTVSAKAGDTFVPAHQVISAAPSRTP